MEIIVQSFKLERLFFFKKCLKNFIFKLNAVKIIVHQMMPKRMSSFALIRITLIIRQS